MYYAYLHINGKVIAEAFTYKMCSDLAFDEMPWGGNPDGEVAPYYITTIPPADCSICYEKGVIDDFHDPMKCIACDGTGYSFNGGYSHE